MGRKGEKRFDEEREGWMVFGGKNICPFADNTEIEQLDKSTKREKTIITFATMLRYIRRHRLPLEISIIDNSNPPYQPLGLSPQYQNRMLLIIRFSESFHYNVRDILI